MQGVANLLECKTVWAAAGGRGTHKYWLAYWATHCSVPLLEDTSPRATIADNTCGSADPARLLMRLQNRLLRTCRHESRDVGDLEVIKPGSASEHGHSSYVVSPDLYACRCCQASLAEHLARAPARCARCGPVQQTAHKVVSSLSTTHIHGAEKQRGIYTNRTRCKNADPPR
jgi:hypothetical protein